jgi:tetratricopeptide (TPR) repeat protein
MEIRSSPVLRTSVLVFAGMAALFALDTFLAKTDEAARQATARRLFEEGQRLERQGFLGEAVGTFRTALSNARSNRQYQLALAQALVAAGRAPEAEASLTELLDQDSTDGGANLTMARLLAGEGKIPEAIAYYRRAIYGRWREDADGNRVRARFELVDLLARQGEKRELLAELLPLQDEAPQDAETRMRIGRLFLTAGAPNRATEVFRSVLRRRPQDADAYAGLGEAEFALGRYRTAQGDFLAALRSRPGGAQIQAQLELCRQVLALDPNGRGIGARERYQRSRKLVDLALEGARNCAGATPPQPLAEVMTKRPGPDVEGNLDLAEQLWQAWHGECGTATSPQDQALALVMARLAQ